ncbi:MAG: DUF2202 domain-containing protein [Chitinophagaceae bacterium]|nr:DUF2202 domain-containing protein [Chitinophagaceae bacterium]MCB9046762.1 DUF2202 domain-containing protein [Chitinophagales bacterium]
MKKTLVIALALTAAFGFTSCKKEKTNVVPTTSTTTPTSATITAFEQQSITFTREEEKMARDVYTTLVAKWTNMAFLNNIIASEQKHMDAVKTLLDKFNMSDPVANNGVGVFTNPDIQKLYNDLVAKGNQSELDAIIVGLTIEDMDIYDIEKALFQVQNADIATVYNNLAGASKNHMREFYTQLQAKGGTYTPQYITQQEYNDIVTTPKVHGHN